MAALDVRIRLKCPDLEAAPADVRLIQAVAGAPQRIDAMGTVDWAHIRTEIDSMLATCRADMMDQLETLEQINEAKRGAGMDRAATLDPSDPRGEDGDDAEEGAEGGGDR